MRRLLQRLCDLGVLLEYTVDMRMGQRICVLIDGSPRFMSPGTARAYADRLEAQVWGFVS